MSDNQHTEFRFELRGDVTLRTLRASDLAGFITELEKLLRNLTREKYPDLKPDGLRASVMAIEAGSVSVVVAPSHPELVMPVAVAMAEDLNNNRAEDWPSPSLKPLKKIRTLAMAVGATAGVVVPLNGHVVEASLTDPVRPSRLANLRGRTTVYGQVTRLGGVEPKVDLRLVGSSQPILHCEADETMVKSLEGQLYEYVSLNGVGQWDPFSYELKEFKVESWQPFANGDPVVAMETLREQFGKYFDDIDDKGAGAGFAPATSGV